MGRGSLEILRQTGWDLWVVLCVVAALTLLSYAAAVRLWRSRVGWIALAMVAIGVVGTTVVLAVPSLHHPVVGWVWTFILLAVLSATFYLNLYPRLSARRISLLLTLRILALALMVTMFFEPVIRYVVRPKPYKPLLVLVDTSGSMSVPDIPNGPTRLQSAWQALRPQLRRLSDHFVPQFYGFSTDLEDLRRPEDLAQLTPAGQATDIARAAKRARYKTNTGGASIILITDGIDNISSDVVHLVRDLGWPIHTVRVGSEQAQPATLANVAVENVEAADDFVVGHETKISILVRSSALNNRVVEVKLAALDGNNKPTGEQKSATLVLQATAEGQTVELTYKPRGIGVHRLAAWVDPIPGERSLADNRQEFQGLALDPRIKVLYIEGRARPEYRDLVRALGRDPNIEVASLLRLQQERFVASGTVNGQKFEQMPVGLEQWNAFDVIILGDLDSTFLSKLQQEAIEKRVAAGGALLMTGGENSFGPGGYQGSPIETALPVFAGEVKSPQEKTQFIPRLTADGAVHPAMEGLTDWFGVEDKKGARAAEIDPHPLRGNVVVPKAKSGAQVLLVHPDRPGPEGKPQIVLAVQRYGQGRSAAFTADTTYLWYLPLRGMGQDSPYNRFWGQLVRWLAGEDVRNRQRGAGVEGLLNKSVYQLGESVRVRALVRDERGDATQYAQTGLILKKPGEKDRQFPMSAVDALKGLYELTIPAAELDKGDYKIELSATKDGKTLGRQELSFKIIPPAEEMLKVAANPDLLMRIANATGGKYADLGQLSALVDDLVRADKAAMTARQEVVPLANAVRATLAALGSNPEWSMRYNLPMQALLIGALLCGEWVLRRRWQLP